MRTNAKVYVLKAPDGTIKLGHAKNVERRKNEIGRHLDIVHQTDVLEQAERIERLAHRILALHGKHLKGEWFEATLEDAILAIEIATRQAEGEELNLGGQIIYSAKRPATKKIMLTIKLPPDLIRSVDECIDAMEFPPTRTRLIERLLEAWVTARRKERGLR